MARVYVGVSRHELERLRDHEQLTPSEISQFVAYVSTPDWIQVQSDQDDEVLEDALLHLAASSGAYVIVGEIESSALIITDKGQAQAVITGVVLQSAIRAFFSVDSSSDLLWFGPTELPEILEFSSN